MKKFHLIGLLLLFVLFCGCSAAPIKVVFDSPQQIKGINKIAVFPFVCNRSETGRTIAEALAANLDTSRFAVIEQGQLQTLLKANRLTLKRVSENPQLVVGQLKGVDAIIAGNASVRAFGGYSEHVAETTARMIDVATGKILLEVTFSSENVKSLTGTTPADQIGKELAQKFSSY
jgi:hypothetical protein